MMTLPPILPLPPEIVHWMGAGEVMDSWGAIVRELAENSLDAGATHLHLTLWPSLWRLRLVDNGGGMDRENLLKAATPHSTSKFRTRQVQGHESPDLAAIPITISTLGFRGEALHSLAQLGELEICSRSPQEETGWQVVYDRSGSPLRCQPVALAPGTIVTVRDLFSATWSRRRQALPPVKQALRSIQTVIHNLALTHPQVTWQAYQGERSWLSLRPVESPRLLLPQCLTRLQPQDLVEQSQVWPDGGSLKVVLGLPDRCHRPRPDWVRVAVNGRVVHCPELEQVILNGFQRTLPRRSHGSRFPVGVALFQIPPDQVDWHRHPHKTEIYLEALACWQTRLGETIATALALPAAIVGEPYANQRVDRLLKTAEAQSSYQISLSTPLKLTSGTEDAVLAPQDSALRFKAIGQVHQMYIVAESATGLCLIEQHIAHERVLFEQLCDRWAVVELPAPLLLSHLQDGQIQQLQQIGLDCEPFGEQQWIVRTVPAPLIGRSDCEAAIVELSLGGDLTTAQVAVACRTALRNGTPLSLVEMQSLLDQWQRTRHPHTCPHGRPICLKLEESSLSRFFRRHWVVGKSHGAFPV